MTAVKMSKKERNENKPHALEILNKYCPKGTTVYTINRHTSSSGMTRYIQCLVIGKDHNGNPELVDISWAISVILEWPLVEGWSWRAIKVSGCGMDMGFHLVNSLSYALHGHGNHNAKGYERSGYTLDHEWK